MVVANTPTRRSARLAARSKDVTTRDSDGGKSKTRPSFLQILKKAGWRALGGGLPGFLAMMIQVIALMWMRTIVNYQYKSGGTFEEAFKTLYAEGGVGRFYKGFWFAIVVGPLGRFGDTAANEGILAVMAEMFPAVPVVIATMLASCGAAAWRATTQPLQNMKTLLQVEGNMAFSIMSSKIKDVGTVPALWDGLLGTMMSTWLGHYPWFAVSNFLRQLWPEDKKASTAMKLMRNAIIGFCSQVVADCFSNWLRAITTKKQTMQESLSYIAVTQIIIDENGGGWQGILGLMGRGLITKILSNGIQAMLFSVLWKYFEAKYKDYHKK